MNPATTGAVGRGFLCLRHGAGKKNEGGAADVLWAIPAAVAVSAAPARARGPAAGRPLVGSSGPQAASSPTSGTPSYLFGVACPRPSTCVAVGDRGTILRTTDGGRTWRSVW